MTGNVTLNVMVGPPNAPFASGDTVKATVTLRFGDIHANDIQLPPDFPERYKAEVIRAADMCKVKKHLEHPPVFEIKTSVTDLAAV